MATDGIGLTPGDRLRIERRYIVEGQLTCVTDEGRFQRVERIGTHDHLVLKDASKGLRMFPLAAIAEITVVKPARRARTAPAEAHPWDPSVA